MSDSSASHISALVDIVGAEAISTTQPDRTAYARDLWPRSQLDRLAGNDTPRPLAVVWPSTPEQIADVVRYCAGQRVPIVPFGAGSGVCGGARSIDRGIVLDVKRLKAIRSLDPKNGVVEVEAGLIGERFERILERKGLTLGHFPSSILCSTVGGWIAGRSAGQCSSRYGKIEDMVVDLEVVTGDGVIRRTPRVDAAGGLDWNQLFIGSEGTLGIITAATLKVHPQPAERAFHGWLMPSVEAGVRVMREAMQAGLKPSVLRLYDALDTWMVGTDPESDHGGPLDVLKHALIGGGSGGPSSPRVSALKKKALCTILGSPKITNRLVRFLPKHALLVTVSEGSGAEANDSDALIARIAVRAGGKDLGEAPGRTWLAHRYDVSYKQSKIYSAGAFVDTFEVAAPWSKIGPLYEAVRRAVSPHVLVMAHFSHAYPGGASIYFTFAGAGRDPHDAQARYDAAWQAGLDTTVDHGAAIAHHHGAGLSRASHMPRVHGAAVSYFEALKATLDPAGIMNPGKLFGAAR